MFFIYYLNTDEAATKDEWINEILRKCLNKMEQELKNHFTTLQLDHIFFWHTLMQ